MAQMAQMKEVNQNETSRFSVRAEGCFFLPLGLSPTHLRMTISGKGGGGFQRRGFSFGFQALVGG